MLRATAGAAIAVPMAALAIGPATAVAGTAAAGSAAAGRDDGGSTGPGSGSGPVMFCVPDAGSGQVSILHGTSEVVVTDHRLVARIMAAAAATV
jgi:hypothetical protein